MRIAQLIDSLYVGGAERLQLTFMRTALTRGLQTTLITFNCFPEQHYYLELKSMGVSIIEIKGHNLFDPVLFGKLVRVLRDGKYDILHTHLTYSIILGGLAGWLTRTPVVASLHNLGNHSWRFLEAVVLRFFTNRCIAVGWTVAETHKKIVNRYPIDVIQNPIETPQRYSESEKLKIRSEITADTGRLLLITVGRLVESKGYDDLLDVIDELRRTHPKTLLVIVGKGNYSQAITTKIESLHLNDHVKLLGLRSDVQNLLAVSDIYVSASHSEGLPVSLLEAMAAGLPVVATNVGDIPSIIKPEFGICVPAHQPDQISAALSYLIENPEQRALFGSKAREYVIQNHSSDRWIEQIIAIYDQMMVARNNVRR